MLPPPAFVAAPKRFPSKSQSYSGESFNLTDDGLTRRSEFLFGIDEVGLDVYGGRTPKLLTNRKLPTGERFVCAPVSLVVKQTETKKRERFTYWATLETPVGANPALAGKAQIYCLHEDGEKSKVFRQPLPNWKSKGHIRFLRLVRDTQSGSQLQHLVLAITARGHIICFSPKLDSERWATQLSTLNSDANSVAVQDAATFGEQDGLASCFKSASGFATQLSPSGVNPLGTRRQFLGVVDTGDGASPKLRCYLVGESLTHILSSSFSDAGRSDATRAEWSIYAKSGTVQRADFGDTSRVSLYDGTRTTLPLKASLDMPSISSVIRMSASTIGVASQRGLELINVRWGSVDEEGALSTTGAPASTTASEPVRLLAYLPSAKCIFLVLDKQLMSVSTDSGPEVQQKSSKRRKVGSLAGAIGRGIGTDGLQIAHQGVSTENFGKEITARSFEEDMKRIEETFGPLLAKKDIDHYDRELHKELKKTFGPESTEDLSQPHLAKPALIDYAIGEMFQYKPIQNSNAGGTFSLEIKRMAPEVFRFLLIRGLLSPYQIGKSLSTLQQASPKYDLSAVSIVDALFSHDNSLQALIYYLGSAPILGADELVVAIAHSIRLDLSAEQGESQKMLSNSRPDADVAPIADTRMRYLDDADKSAFDGEWQDPDVDEGLSHDARSALRSCLARLSLCGDIDICRAMKTKLQPEEVLALIDYIRIELAGGGWLLSNIDNDPDDQSNLSSQTSQINILSKILNCAVDSLGTSIIKLASGKTGSLRQMEKVEYMKAEVNAALAGIQDNANLQQLLNEVLLFSKSSVQIHHGEMVKSIANTHRSSNMLPFGLKKANLVPTTKRERGGEDVPMSKRHIAYLMSKKIPDYSFEKIQI